MKNIKSYVPHALAVLGFVIVALIYFYPVMQNKVIFQSDIAQYTGMAKEQNDFRQEKQQEPYWTNSAFGGMPTYQLGANYPHNYVKKIDSLLRFLPRPADYLFLYFIGFYILLMVLKVDPLKAFFGALAFGFSTYLIIILGVGHNAKAHAIAYMPMVLAGVLLVFQKRYWLGGILTMIAAALEIQANHPQMTYYLLILLLVVGIFYVIRFIKEKAFVDLAKVAGVFAVTGILAIGANATGLMATSEYAKFSTRSNSELTYEADGSRKENTNAMSYDYITQYSYGKAESLNLIAPRLFGGSNHEDLGVDSEMYRFVTSQGVPPYEAMQLVKQMPTYWGDQPIVAAPAYIGIVVFFFFVLAMFLPQNRKIKYILFTGALVSLFLSWGKNFALLTDFFINYVPMYNKFRAVSSIQVVLELCIPALAVLGFYEFFKLEDKKQQWDFLWKSTAVTFGLLVMLFVFKGAFDFAGGSDAYYNEAYGPEFMRVLREDRASLYTQDVLRSMGFVIAVFVILFLVTKETLKSVTAVILVGVLMVGDLFFIDKNYVNKENFVSKREMEQPFQPTQADKQILQDTSQYRVFDFAGNMNSARASYFHHSIGGYHAAKPRRMQQLFDYQIAKNNVRTLNMLNVKYVIQTDEEGQPIALENPSANGNAWFVEKVQIVNSADEEMKALDDLDTKKVAIYNPDSTIKMKANFNAIGKDSLAAVQLVKYEPNYLKYTSNNSKDGFAVFSEMYYKNGWKATIDGEETPIYNVDYVLRGLYVPAGKHTIEFRFEPQVVKTGSTITLFSSIAMILVVAGGIYVERKKKIQA
ncbi:YfhO family protein [Flavobacterium sp. NRK F10]|uniref:YfhO family protein n=1 Tax=Flavobacterium sp. NRK F10 TaxID=2954931 RepID=UPI002091660D|nr:YfhO family protein [Flavobacterium sp. NRK F10]MCO6175782.1 YfhO family protein [Flavobacterium sp. NRK F10]